MPIKELSPVNSYHLPIRSSREKFLLKRSAVQYRLNGDTTFAPVVVTCCGYLYHSFFSFVHLKKRFGTIDNFFLCQWFFHYLENVAVMDLRVRWLVLLSPIGKHFVLRVWGREYFLNEIYRDFLIILYWQSSSFLCFQIFLWCYIF